MTARDAISFVGARRSRRKTKGLGATRRGGFQSRERGGFTCTIICRRASSTWRVPSAAKVESRIITLYERLIINFAKLPCSILGASLNQSRLKAYRSVYRVITSRRWRSGKKVSRDLIGCLRYTDSFFESPSMREYWLRSLGAATC